MHKPEKYSPAICINSLLMVYYKMKYYAEQPRDWGYKMDAQILKNIAIDGSVRYYEYLKQYSKGLDKITVSKVEFIDNFVCLHTNDAVDCPDKVEIEICGTVYDKNDIRVIEFDSDENTVLAMPKINLKPLFYQVEPKDIKVVSDLKYVVDDVISWYENADCELGLPTKAPEIDFELEYGSNLSESQQEMVKGVFDNPFTFIWGVRGAAKTFAVLADCVMNYVRNGKKIIITAPTNDAVDRTLSYVLEVIKREGLPMKNVLRLGLPSKKFVRRYRDVCELFGIDKMVTGMESRITDLEDAYEFFVYSEQYEKMKSEFPEVFTKLAEVYSYKQEVRGTLDAVNEEWDRLTGRRERLNNDIKRLNDEFVEINDIILDYNSRKVKFLVRNKLEEAEERKSQLRKALDIKNKHIESLDYDISILAIRKEQLNKAYVGDNRDQMYIEQIKCLTEFDIELLNLVRGINEENHLECKAKLVKIVATYDTLMRQRENQYSMYKDMKLEEILAKINNMNQEKNNLIKMSTLERAKDALVIAAPIDTYITRVSDDDVLDADVQHIFVEEAGNCPAIKGLTLLKQGVPVTLVGDYSQQELTCEMDYNEIVEPGNQSVSMWAQSVLHLEELLLEGFDEFLASYMKERKAPYEDLVMFTENQTPKEVS